MPNNSASSESALADLVSLWQHRRAEGQTATPAELCRDRPELLPELEQRIAALERMAEAFQETVAVTPDSGGDSGVHEAAALDPEAMQPPASPGQAAPAVETLADGPVVPGYELLAVLGKGGMGVVYKARQRGLGRVVALKMILHAEHAGNRERQRFQAEAEAVACLQQPNIVQIYEVGEQRGLPYFSLEFCSGGSLADKLDGTPLPPKEAAILVKTLAVAMQAAHDKGLLHRDLKPANVLLAEEGTPKITDFGLAKKLGEKGQTQTGEVLGTASYMAPEQADGKRKEIGPAVDIYALGAILNELLTGRPPFKEATALDTLLQVINDEPVAVRRLQVKVPKDLETICHKCLNKEPKKRYASAAALAEDLRRFLAGEPVAARPVGSVGRSWRWCRRHPGVAVLTAIVVVLLASSLVAWRLAARALAENGRAVAHSGSATGEREQVLQQNKAAEEALNLRDVRISSPPRNGNGNVAVQTNKSLYELFGAENTAISIVFDCSGSMSYQDGKDPNNRFHKATRALKSVLEELPKGVWVSLRAFGALEFDRTGALKEKDRIKLVWPSHEWKPERLQEMIKNVDRLSPYYSTPLLRSIR